MNQTQAQNVAQNAAQKNRKASFSKKIFTERPHLPDTDKFGMDKEPSRFDSKNEETEPKSWRSSGDDL